MIRQFIDPFVLNPKESVYSAIRKQKRPIEGLLHSCFVLSRVCFGLKKLIYTISPTDESYQVTNNMIAESQEYLISGITILEEKAQFTDKGQQLFTSIKRLNS